MRIQFLILLPILSYVQAVKYAPRTYIPSEEDPERIHILPWEDEKGNIHLEDLDDDKLATISPASTLATYNYQLLLFTKTNPNVHEEISVINARLLRKSVKFNRTKRNFFLIHGWKNDNSTRFNRVLRSALLSTHDVNVFVVDWGKEAKKLYIQSKAAINSIGPALGRYIQQLINNFNLTSNDVVLYGHSLGAHLAGKVGASMQTKPIYIIGLDPAGPFFTVHNTDDRIDPSDAHHVQIIHTNAFPMGFHSALGHADFYVNGGLSQPGCGVGVSGFICSHTRAFDYLADSLRNCNSFARKCNSYDNYISGICINNSLTHMGCYDVDTTARGDFHIKTRSKSPFFRKNKGL